MFIPSLMRNRLLIQNYWGTNTRIWWYIPWARTDWRPAPDSKHGSFKWEPLHCSVWSSNDKWIWEPGWLAAFFVERHLLKGTSCRQLHHRHCTKQQSQNSKCEAAFERRTQPQRQALPPISSLYITRVSSESLKCTDHFRDQSLDWRIILKRILQKLNTWIWTEFVWLRIGASGGLLWER
jgi:hypothetical protein